MSLATPRVDYESFSQSEADLHAALIALTRAAGAGLEKELTELVKLRVSQLNACAFCLQLHLNVANKLGIAKAKLDLLAAWRDAGVYTPREMAALAWADRVTRLNGEPVSDADWKALRQHFSEPEARQLTATVAVINNWNRIAMPLAFAPQLPTREGV